MFSKKITILLITSVLFFFQACSDTPTDIGSGLLEQDQIIIKNVDSAVDTIGVSAYSFKRTINLGTSSRLLLGKKGNVESGILIRFNYLLADTLLQQIKNSSVTVESAWMQFTSNYTYGSETDPLDVTIHNVTSGWTTAGFNSDSLSSLQYDATDQKIIDTSDTRFDINPQLAFNWIKAAADTAIAEDFGAYIKPAATSSKIMGYYAIGSEETASPLLNVVTRRISDGTIDTLTFSTFADLGVVSGELAPLGDQYLSVQAGLEAVSRIKFDISKIPVNAIVNKAELILSLDSSKTVLGSSYISSLMAGMILDSVKVDSVSGSVVLNRVNNTYNGDVTLVVQTWLRSDNNGLLISSSNRLLGVELFAFYGASADSYLRPRLIITYTVKQ